MSSVKQPTSSEGRMKNAVKVNDKTKRMKEANKRAGLDNVDLLVIFENELTLEENADEFIPTVKNKAKTSDLNLNRQYKRRVNHCNGRKLFRIHDFSKSGD